MGRLEKIVVVTVLFLVAIILAVSLGDEGDGGLARIPDPAADPILGRAPVTSGNEARGPEGAGPLAGLGGPELERAALGGAAPADEPASSEPSTAATPDGMGGADGMRGPGGLLSGNAAEISRLTRPGEREAAAAPAADAAGAPAASNAYLRTEEGLERTEFGAEFMLYSWSAGDSFASLAERYYGSARHARRLSDANEGRPEAGLVAGDRIWILAAPLGEAARGGDAAGEPTPGSTYVVQHGDILGTIAQRAYGKASKYRKIFEANRHLLVTENDLREGQELFIPPLD